MDKPNDILIKSSINTAIKKFESYWGYREDKQSEIVESVFKELKENNKLISQNVSKSLPNNFKQLPEKLQCELVSKHTHAELVDGEKIVYKEQDVLDIIKYVSENNYL